MKHDLEQALVRIRRDRSDHAGRPLFRALAEHVDGEVGFAHGTRRREPS